MLQTVNSTPNYFTVTEAGKSVLFKEWELIVDEEDEVLYYSLNYSVN